MVVQVKPFGQSAVTCFNKKMMIYGLRAIRHFAYPPGSGKKPLIFHFAKIAWL